MQQTIGGRVRKLSNKLRQEMAAVKIPETDAVLSGLQGMVIRILKEADDDNKIFQYDLEKQLDIQGPTVTQTLKSLENHGLIERKINASDGRKKELKLTDKGLLMHQQTSAMICSLEARMRQGLTEEDLALFFRIMDQLEMNLTSREDGHVS